MDRRTERVIRDRYLCSQVSLTDTSFSSYFVKFAQCDADDFVSQQSQWIFCMGCVFAVWWERMEAFFTESSVITGGGWNTPNGQHLQVHWRNDLPRQSPFIMNCILDVLSWSTSSIISVKTPSPLYFWSHKCILWVKIMLSYCVMSTYSQH